MDPSCTLWRYWTSLHAPFGPFLFGANLSEPHINGLSSVGYYGVSYDRPYVGQSSIWPPGCRDQIYLQLSTLRAWCGLGRKWLLLADISNFSCGAIQVIIILTEMTVVVQSCPPSMIYTSNQEYERLLQLYSLCTAVSGHTQRGWLKHSNRVQNPLVCRHSGQSCTKYTCKHHPSSRDTKVCMCQALLQHFPHTFPCSWNVAAWSGVQPVPSFWALMSADHRAVCTLEATTESTPSSVPQHTCTLLQKARHNIVKTPKRCCGCWIIYTMCKLTGCTITEIQLSHTLYSPEISCYKYTYISLSLTQDEPQWT